MGLRDRNTYSVMQSDWNSVCGDVVLDSFNMACRDEDSILDILGFGGGQSMLYTGKY